jgi:TPR repeat protein
MMYSFRLALILAFTAGLLISLPDISRAQTNRSNISFEDAARAFFAGDNKLALRHFLTLSHKGDPQAQYFLAYMFDVGQGTGQDIHEAARWYIRSAEQGYLPAEVYAGYIFATGHGVPEDREEAIEWYRRAAEKGDDIAQNNLGSLLLESEDSKKRFAAGRWFMSSALQGNANAQYNLANMYRKGKGIKRNMAEAARWYLLAALQGNMYAQNAMAFMYKEGYGITQDKEKAIEWYRRAAEQKLGVAQFHLARLYEQAGKKPGLEPQKRDSYFSLAAIWYYHAAKQGDEEAAFYLADFYRRGRGVPQNLESAVQWLQRAVEKDYIPAKIELARFYQTGQGGLKKDPQLAMRWYLEAAEKGNGLAMFEVANMHYRGIGTDVDLIDAFKWFALAVDNLEPGDEVREEAIIARVEVSNRLDTKELNKARSAVTRWKAAQSN